MIKQIPLPEKRFSWYDVTAPDDADISTLAHEFDLPFLLVQDCLKPEHLPKYEVTEEGFHFLMMRSYDKDAKADATTVQELTRKVALFISRERVVTSHRVDLSYLWHAVGRCEKPDAFPKNIQMLVHQIILDGIRTYEEPMDALQDVYEAFETEVLSKKADMNMMRVYHFRRKLFVLKRLLKQTNDSLYRSKEFWDKQQSMLQDLRENLDQLYFRLDEISDNFEHLLELQIQMDDQKANDVMKTLTVFSTVLLPLNFIASFYGMNFTTLPGLNSPHALAGISILMIVVWIICLIYFRYRGWFKTRKR
ncbi:MAG: CorA family divalent cation transporter [Bacteriovoracaceae bacterium]